MTDDALVIFTPSGKRGRFALGTPILTAARQLGVDLDSVCGGPWHLFEVPDHARLRRVSKTRGDGRRGCAVGVERGRGALQAIRGLATAGASGCQAKVMGDVVIDVPPESQVHKQVIRKSATERDIVMDPATRRLYVEVEEPDMHEPTGDFERLSSGAARTMAGRRMSRPICACCAVCNRPCARANGR